MKPLGCVIVCLSFVQIAYPFFTGLSKQVKNAILSILATSIGGCNINYRILRRLKYRCETCHPVHAIRVKNCFLNHKKFKRGLFVTITPLLQMEIEISCRQAHSSCKYLMVNNQDSPKREICQNHSVQTSDISMLMFNPRDARLSCLIGHAYMPG